MTKLKNLFKGTKDEKQAIMKLRNYKVMYFVDPLSKKEDKIIKKLFDENLIEVERGKIDNVFHVKWIGDK